MYEAPTHLPDLPGTRRDPVISNAVLGTLIFVICEVMFFGGFISAFMIVKTQALGVWPPPGQPRLPVGETAFNTAALLASGALLVFAHFSHARRDGHASRWLMGSIALGAFFVLFQGNEWVGLIREGLTLTSSTHGSFFYTIIGLHAAHAVIALAVLVWTWIGMLRDRLEPDHFHAAQVFWYFVVGLWPILYVQVYL